MYTYLHMYTCIYVIMPVCLHIYKYVCICPSDMYAFIYLLTARLFIPEIQTNYFLGFS